MKIGVPKEIKPQEFRVGMTPNAAQEAVAHGHSVLVETGGKVHTAIRNRRRFDQLLCQKIPRDGVKPRVGFQIINSVCPRTETNCLINA